MTAEFHSLLPSNSTPFEQAEEGVSGPRWDLVDTDLVRKFKDPWQCPEHLLNFLAFERSVDIWDESWTVLKKRSVIASAPSDHRIKTTLAGIRRYIAIAGASLLQVVTPPEGFFAAPDLSKSELDAYVARHPKVRITLARGSGKADVQDGVFADDAYAEEATTGVDDGPVLYGRRAYLVKDGVETPLQLVQLDTTTETKTGVTFERVVTPGRAVAESFADEIGAGIGFADSWDVPPRFYSFALDQAYQHANSRLELTTVTVGFLARDTRYVRESKPGQGSAYAFAGDFAGEGFAGLNDGGALLADVIRLYDPSIVSPVVAGGGFAGVTRVGMEHHRAEMLIDLLQVDIPHSGFIAEQSFAGEDPAAPGDTRRRDFVLDAVASSKRLSDRIGITFQTRRDRTLADGFPLNGTARLGDTVKNVL